MQNRFETRKAAVNRALLLTLLALAFAAGVFVGSGMSLFSASGGRGDAVTGSADGTFRFIRSIVPPGGARGGRSTRELKPFQYKVSELVERIEHDGDAAAVSVYFRDLNNGNWFGIREHDKFSPQSLLKVPLMIAYFKWAESSPVVLRRTLVYTGNAPADENVPAGELRPGKSYTVNDLIVKMISHDDPASYSLLYANIPPQKLEKIYKDLYVEYDPRKPEDSLSLSAFAAFFRVLYNASYLSEEMSEKALRYLSRSSFSEGMKAGIPKSTEIASKAGERMISMVTEGEEHDLHQLHEFGIVYHPTRPFLLGIMTRGDDTEKLAKVIHDITHLVYEEVDRQS